MSPDVAVRMTVSSSTPVCFFAANISCGSIESATSLNADVGPLNSSSTYLSPTFTKGVKSGVSNLFSYARLTSLSMSLKSGSRCERTMLAISSVSFPITECQSNPSAMFSSEMKRPPSGAIPLRTACSELHLYSPRVLLYSIYPSP